MFFYRINNENVDERNDLNENNKKRKDITEKQIKKNMIKNENRSISFLPILLVLE